MTATARSPMREMLERIAAGGTDWRRVPEPPAGHPSGTLWRSSAGPFLDAYSYRWPAGETAEPDAMCDRPFRIVKLYREDLAIMTYCEGDLDLEHYPTEEAFNHAVISAYNFYTQEHTDG